MTLFWFRDKLNNHPIPLHKYEVAGDHRITPLLWDWHCFWLCRFFLVLALTSGLMLASSLALALALGVAVDVTLNLTLVLVATLALARHYGFGFGTWDSALTRGFG